MSLWRLLNMQSNILLKTLLRSTSLWNRLRNEKDKKARSKIKGSIAGTIILYVLLVAFSFSTSLALGFFKYSNSIPALCITLLTVFEFFTCLLRTNGYLFSLADYDMTMSLPFSVQQVVSTRFLYMYVKNIPLVLCISLPMMLGYDIYVKPPIYVYFGWIILTAFIPLIPMTLASAIGTCIAAAGTRFRHKTLVQTILMFVLVLFLFSLRFIIESIAQNGMLEATVESLEESISKASTLYLPIRWFEKAIVDVSIPYMLLFIALSLAVFELVFFIISRFYRQIISRLMTGTAGKAYSLKELKVRSPVQSVAFKEFKCMTASTNYIVNMGIGFVLSLIVCLVIVIFGFDQFIMFFTHGHAVDSRILLPAVPFFVFFLTGMTSTTSVSYSLEGKNVWIVQSLPLSKRKLVNGKMLFNLYLSLPFTLLTDIVLAISAHASLLETISCALCGVIQCFYASTWGMFVGLSFPHLEWKTDIEVIKSSSAAALYMLPNMFLTLGLGVVAVIFGFKFPVVIVICLVMFLYAILALLSYLGVRAKTPLR